MKNHVKPLRKKRQLTQQQFADLLGVSRQTVISIELEKYDPSLPLAFKISRILNKPIENIFLEK